MCEQQSIWQDCIYVQVCWSLCLLPISLGSSLIIFFFFFIFPFLGQKLLILIKINNRQLIPLMWYLTSLFFFRILALEKIAEILMTGPRLVAYKISTEISCA